MCNTYLVAIRIDLYHCLSVEDNLTADSRVACRSRVALDQTAGHPEALLTAVVIYTTAEDCYVAGDLTAVEGERTVVENTTTVAGCLTAGDLSFTHDSKGSVIDDDTTIHYCARERAVNNVSVQFQHDGLACRYNERTFAIEVCYVCCQLDNTALCKCVLQGCPTADLFFLIHLDACVLALQFGDLTVLEGYMQGLLTHTGLCRQVAGQSICIRAVRVRCFACLREGCERQVECVVTTHERCMECICTTTAVTDHTRVDTVTCPDILTESCPQFLQELVLECLRIRSRASVAGKAELA